MLNLQIDSRVLSPQEEIMKTGGKGPITKFVAEKFSQKQTEVRSVSDREKLLELQDRIFAYLDVLKREKQKRDQNQTGNTTLLDFLQIKDHIKELILNAELIRTKIKIKEDSKRMGAYNDSKNWKD